MKAHLVWFLDHFGSSSSQPSLALKELERRVGFMVHLAMTYPLMFPFLRSLFLTMNSWRVDRDDSGWKMSRRAYESYLSAGRREGDSGISHRPDPDFEAPVEVTAVPSLFVHLQGLSSLFAGDTPTLRLIRGASTWEVSLPMLRGKVLGLHG